MYNPNTSDDAFEFEPIDFPAQPTTSQEQHEVPDLVRRVLDIGMQLNDYRAHHLEQHHQEAA